MEHRLLGAGLGRMLRYLAGVPWLGTLAGYLVGYPGLGTWLGYPGLGTWLRYPGDGRKFWNTGYRELG